MLKFLVIILFVFSCGRGGGISCPQKPQPAVDTGKQDGGKTCEPKR